MPDVNWAGEKGGGGESSGSGGERALKKVRRRRRDCPQLGSGGGGGQHLLRLLLLLAFEIGYPNEGAGKREILISTLAHAPIFSAFLIPTVWLLLSLSLSLNS